MHNPTLDKDINPILATLQSNGSEREGDAEQLKEEKPEEFDVYIEDDRITVVKRPEPQAQVIESRPVTPQKTSVVPAYIAILVYLLLLLSCLTFQIWVIFNPPTVTITIIPKSQAISLTGTLQLGR